MSFDKLQEKIRKLKNPTVVMFDGTPDQIPPHIVNEFKDEPTAYLHYCKQLLDVLKPIVPAVRFRMQGFWMLGAQGTDVLQQLLHYADAQGYYVLLDIPEAMSLSEAERYAKTVFEGTAWPCDGVITSCYIGEDALSPFVRYLKKSDKTLFVILRTGNKTAAQLQDLLSGSRLVHMAAADMVARLGEPYVGQRKYSAVAAVGSAAAADSLRTMRTKYPAVFLLADGFDYSNANAKNCSFAFDRLGHGSAVCAGESITAAWKRAQSDGLAYLDQAVEVAERMKKNLLRYISIL